MATDMDIYYGWMESRSWIKGKIWRGGILHHEGISTDYAGKQSGYGGQTKPVFHKKAKTVCPYVVQ